MITNPYYIPPFKISSACFLYGPAVYHVAEANLKEFPDEVSRNHLQVAAITTALTRLGGRHVTFREFDRITIQPDGIVYEGYGWVVTYGPPNLITNYSARIAGVEGWP